jgi:putative membrane protein
MLQAAIQKNDKQAKIIIGIFSLVVFTAVVLLSRFKLQVDLGFDVHLFAKANAVINTLTAILLVAALLAVMNKKYILHKRLMTAALILSVIFLVSYIAHHLLAGETKFGGTGIIRPVYFIILITHIFLASVILPFILFTAYLALTAEFVLHKKLARYTWPLWFYVAVTGPVVYLLLSPYYH